MNKRGIAFIVIGAVLLALALGLVVYNLWTDKNGEKSFAPYEFNRIVEQTERMYENLPINDSWTNSLINPIIIGLKRYSV